VIGPLIRECAWCGIFLGLRCPVCAGESLLHRTGALFTCRTCLTELSLVLGEKSHGAYVACVGRLREEESEPRK